MKNELTSKSVVCFGEVLWDILLTGKKPGGAPMNVAYHLHTLGINSTLVSRVGNDPSGKELMQFLENINLSTRECQIDPINPTSEVHAEIHENHEVIYDILYPVAWDFIEWKNSFDLLLEDTDAFVFGSLSARNKTSRETLFRMLDHAKYRVFDINLRAPHYSPEIIHQLLERSDMVKLNSNELRLVSDWFGELAINDEAGYIKTLQDKFGIKEILVTKGSKGASFYTPSVSYNYPAFPVQVADTVGSGDSFLAAFIAKKLKGEPLDTMLNYALALGAFITTYSGACPSYNQFDLERFIWQKTWKFN